MVLKNDTLVYIIVSLHNYFPLNMLQFLFLFSSYCRQPFSKDVPDVWLCQPCGIGSMSSSSSLTEDLPRTLTPNPSDVVDHESTCSAGSSKLPNYEEIVKTEKVEHTPVEEVRGLPF